MVIKPLRDDLFKFLKNHQLTAKFEKQKLLFESDYRHPSLNTEILDPKELKIYSFRIDRKYRAIFIIVQAEAEIVDINNHYK